MIGVHVSKVSKVLDKPNQTRKTMLDAIKKDTEELGISVVQIFTHGPRNSYKTKNLDEEKIKEYCETNGVALYVHSAYMTVGIWSANKATANTAKSKNTMKLVAAQLETCDKLGAEGFVIHLPKKEPEHIINSFEATLPVLKKYKTPIILEMTAVLPDSEKTYETPQKINRLTKAMHEAFPKYTNWGWCIDTAHLWGAGIPVGNAKVMKKWFADLTKPKKVHLLHLNGASKNTFATGKDKHIVVFSAEDDIWKDKKKSLEVIRDFAVKYGIPSICEINRGDYGDIDYSIQELKRMFPEAS